MYMEYSKWTNVTLARTFSINFKAMFIKAMMQPSSLMRDMILADIWVVKYKCSIGGHFVY